MFPETFYETTATISFTLLGLWWIALQAKYNEWIADPLRRRMITIITLYFLLPGSMSLLALLAIEDRALWRIAFVVFCLVGVFATGLLAADARKARGEARENPTSWSDDARRCGYRAAGGGGRFRNPARDPGAGARLDVLRGAASYSICPVARASQDLA
jgi:uncharacterized membrane protein YedE/YeeE